MQNLLRPRVARQFTSVAAFCERGLFSPSTGAARQSRKCGTRKNLAVTDRHYSTADARSRARKGAENKIQTEKLHPHETDHGAQWAARPTGFVRLSVSAVNQKLV